MDTTTLRAAYETLLAAAATPNLGEASDGGWDADHILAHLLSVDAGIAAVALEVVAGSRPGFDNRVSLEPSNLDRIIGEHPGRADLIEHVRSQGAILCDIADHLGEAATLVLVPALMLSGGTVVLDQPIPLAALIDGLATNHIPEHTQQLLALRDTAGVTCRT